MKTHNSIFFCVLALAMASPLMAQNEAAIKDVNSFDATTPSAVNGASANWMGTNVGGFSFDRAINCSSVSGLGPVLGSEQMFYVDTTGAYDFSSTQSYDGYIHIYQIEFDSTNSLMNCVVGDDDGPGGIGTSEILGAALTAGVQYIAVTSAFAAGDEGTFENTISGAGDVQLGAVIGTEPIARFQVIKDFDDDNTASVDVEISCNTGLPLSQPATVEEGDPVTFVVTDFNAGDLNCEITETGVEGYTATYNNGAEDSAVSCVYENVLFEEFYTCNITNELEAVTVEVTKWWMDENPANNPINYAEADYSCANEAFGNAAGSLQFLGDGAVDSFSVFPDWDGTTTCSVNETVVDNGVEFDDSECASLSVTPGNGASCNIYNTRLYEGIPTLSQYGLAILAMLMLGVGFVGFRRIA